MLSIQRFREKMLMTLNIPVTFELNGKKFADNFKEILNFYFNCPTNYLGPTKVLKCEPEWSMSCADSLTFNLSLKIF